MSTTQCNMCAAKAKWDAYVQRTKSCLPCSHAFTWAYGPAHPVLYNSYSEMGSKAFTSAFHFR